MTRRRNAPSCQIGSSGAPLFLCNDSVMLCNRQKARSNRFCWSCRLPLTRLKSNVLLHPRTTLHERHHTRLPETATGSSRRENEKSLTRTRARWQRLRNLAPSGPGQPAGHAMCKLYVVYFLSSCKNSHVPHVNLF